jgi:pyruvate/2-oxoglutarate dehydrogenase complex dihydrolipoamide acyltransferase (E2) component
MAHSIPVPRINNNDDEVKLVELKVAVGDLVALGQVVAAVETDKAVIDVESPAAGWVLGIAGEIGTTVRVGATLVWLGNSADEPMPGSTPGPDERATAPSGQAMAPTAKALALLRQHGLQPGDVPASGERLSAADVQQYLDRRQAAPPGRSVSAAAEDSTPELPGRRVPLLSHERGMLATVTWHRDHAVPGYIEIGYDPAPWETCAAEFAAEHKLLFSPLLPLMAHQLTLLAAKDRHLNATISAGQRHEFDGVNLGFTVQAGDVLYLAVVRDAERLDALAFVRRLTDLQRRAAVHELQVDEVRGATVGFSSMARWKVERHIPVLAPHTALMVAHTVGTAGQGILGASYDHRVLHGADVARTLRHLAKPVPAVSP